MAFAFALAACTVCATAADAAVKPMRGRLTSIDLKSCTIARRHVDGNTWNCSGLRGYPVMYAQGDLRAFVSFGPAAAKRRAATQTLGAFNTIFEGNHRRATVEWRVRRIGNSDMPYATIMRLFTARDGATGEVLVITKVNATEACHLAYIDAKANADAMALARSVADELAPTWNCTSAPRVLGTSGNSPM